MSFFCSITTIIYVSICLRSRNLFPPQAANTTTISSTIPTPTTSSIARSQHNHQPTTKLPPRLSLLSFQPFSLLCNLFFSLSQPKPPEPPAKPPHHVRDPHARQLPPPCFASFFFLPRRGCCMQNSFLHAATN